jgi:murein L,D-transpeptidase YcbB/YkuD
MLTTGTILLAILAAGCGDDQRAREMDAALRATVERAQRPAFVTADAEGTRLWKLTRQFYEKREFAPAWIEDAKPRPQITALTQALHGVSHEGLDPQLYNLSVLEQRLTEASKGFLTSKGFEPKEAGLLDVWLTYLYMKVASDLADGLSDLATADPSWQIKPEKFNPLAHLEAALSQNRVQESLADLTPASVEYRALRTALAEYGAIQEKGGWPTIPVGARLKPGQKSQAVPALAARLAATGDFKGTVPAATARDAAYTRDLVGAVKQFQRRHGLTDDGRVGPEVIAELNVPVEVRVRQIALNMERWRWLPRDLGERFILVNIPEMRLAVHEDGGRIPLTMRVVVGKRDTQTPIFNDEMTYLVLSPYWNVPDSIAQGETLPAMMTDPDFLARNDMEVIDRSGQPVDPASMDLSDPAQYRFRQRPGAQNSLGLIKFMFPNQHNVYLHDTPADSLFTRASRSFSHGCVRLEDPVALALYVLRDQPEWTRERIEEAMHAGEERTVKLKAKLPVYLGYFTVSVTPDRMVQFRRDVYGIDGQQTARLSDRLKRLRKAMTSASASIATPAVTSGRAASR